ncbi:uncharacterized protein BDZ99DRAFT_437293 [Mytilinidion resinicola]|uniref:Uncharacterized protein n=1 Tax=Mytilinidion resinicola TaxID=574789 RepID=A0A6A6Z053_9PEZI|nr:uncharacterized protein BDZ99DRAFT_437293 [Mytilinidion resinicola]KAF2814380.1 hypothetical protein BDZ99DRAFT_437293 [Mytilinidion resinicola]
MPPSRSLFPFRPTFRPTSTSQLPQTCLLRKTFTPTSVSTLPHKPAPFSSSSKLLARKGKGDKSDPRITSIRYHLSHALTPRPLRLSRLRALRHWTIHRAWQLHRSKQRAAAELSLEKQYASMRAACEALRLIDENGMTGRNVGRLYRAAMDKTGVWDGVPIEYARCQTDFPAREGWNHGWTR